MRHAPLDLDAHLGDVGELEGIVGLGEDGIGKILADLVLIDIEGGGEVDITDMVTAQVDVHEPWDEIHFPGLLVELDALHQGGAAVADADDSHIDFTHDLPPLETILWGLWRPHSDVFG